MSDKNEMFIEGLEGLEFQTGMYTYVGRCLERNMGGKTL